jgi:CheY-like chemotaxis protein
MDNNLPFSSGLRAVKQIREATGASQTPVIFLTASKVPALRDQAVALGAAGFLEKPYDANQLVSLVRQAIAAPISPSVPNIESVPGPLPSAHGNTIPSGRTILVVDDDRKIVDALTIRLRSEGHTVIAASDGEAAVDLARSRKPSIVVVDLAPPIEEGLEKVRGILDATGSPDTPVIFITASKVPQVRERAVAFGAAGYLEKPYEAKDLLALIRKALAGAVRT